jgi:oxygen-independent coproporphyrinogen-3 oxidase
MEIYKGNKIKTIYLGGGTPSLLNSHQLNLIFEKINNFFLLEKKAEITIEVNPEDVNIDKIMLLKKLGVNRISLGVQSLNNKILSFLGRTYDNHKITKSIKLLKKKFNNINCDILFALPKYQNIESIEFDLKKLIEFEIKHIAIYDLIIEKNTYFYWLKKHNQLNEINDNDFVEQYKFINRFLTDKNYMHYEISTYAKKKFECHHNLIYWNNNFYIGLGASAHSYINYNRHWNFKFPSTYIENMKSHNIAVEGKETLSARQRLGETIMLLLHLDKGVNFDFISKQFSIDLKEQYLELLIYLKKKKFINLNENGFKLTLKGKLFANTVAENFIEIK